MRGNAWARVLFLVGDSPGNYQRTLLSHIYTSTALQTETDLSTLFVSVHVSQIQVLDILCLGCLVLY